MHVVRDVLHTPILYIHTRARANILGNKGERVRRTHARIHLRGARVRDVRVYTRRHTTAPAESCRATCIVRARCVVLVAYIVCARVHGHFAPPCVRANHGKYTCCVHILAYLQIFKKELFLYEHYRRCTATKMPPINLGPCTHFE